MTVSVVKLSTRMEAKTRTLLVGAPMSKALKNDASEKKCVLEFTNEMLKCEENTAKRRKVLITDFFDQLNPIQSSKYDENVSMGSLEPKSKATGNTEIAPDSGEISEQAVQNSRLKAVPPMATTPALEYRPFHGDVPFIKAEWIASLTAEEKELLDLEIESLHDLWLEVLYQELTKPYFLQLKRFLAAQKDKVVFPPRNQIYSWSHLTPLSQVKCLILGQDPYHNHSQAHGLAFSVLEPTKPPPSLLNIYKTLAIDFPTFVAPNHAQLSKEGKPGGGNLTKWALRGVLMLNAALTVEAHKANSHAKKGWEQFTEQVIRAAIQHHSKEPRGGFVIMAWGLPAQKRVKVLEKLIAMNPSRFKVLSAVHPSPLSAHRGFFELKVFKSCNEWLALNDHDLIDWGLIEGNVVM